MHCRLEKYLNDSLYLWQIVGYTNLNPECIFESLGENILLFWAYKVSSTWCNCLSKYESMLIKYLRVCGRNLCALPFPGNMLVCCRWQKKKSMGKKNCWIAMKCWCISCWYATGMLLIFPDIVLTKRCQIHQSWLSDHAMQTWWSVISMGWHMAVLTIMVGFLSVFYGFIWMLLRR